MLSDEGVVKVLDFGLAKLVFQEEASDEHARATADTASDPRSHPGAIAGTAGYMSPEQATAGKIDSRSDVFSFGAVLYEMVTGRRAFAGNSTAETLAAVVTSQPKVPSEIVPNLPRDLEKLIQRCLRKEPERRFQHMLDVKLELEQIKEDSASRALVSPVPARGRRLRWLAAALGGALLVAAAVWLGRPPREIAPPPAQLVALSGMRGWETFPAFSPDGNEIVFTWGGESIDNGASHLYIKMIGSSETRQLTTDPGHNILPSWSPDGRQIAFVCVPANSQVGEIRLVSPLGGSDRKLSDFPVGEGQLSWSPDGRWLAANRHHASADADPGAGSIYFIPVEGGEPRRVTSPKKLDSDTDPGTEFTPDFVLEGPQDGFRWDAGFFPTCLPPDQAIFINRVRLTTDGNQNTIVHFQDTNLLSQVTGYNVHRSSSRFGPPSAWPLVASNILDMDPVLPNNQWVDTSSDVAPGEIWYYQVVAFNSRCPAEGPF
jgi:hypothetical protein